MPVFGSEVDASRGAGTEVRLSLAAREERRKRGIKFKEEVDAVSAGVMTELCEVMFKDIQLASSTAGLTIPLDFSLNAYLGKRVTVKIKGGDSAFTAFVTGLTHSADLRLGKHLNSFTQVRLSHAKFS